MNEVHPRPDLSGHLPMSPWSVDLGEGRGSVSLSLLARKFNINIVSPGKQGFDTRC